MKSRRDIVACIAFVAAITLMGAAAFLPRADATLGAENRTLAAWPRTLFARDFAGTFERAFADRFGGREALLRLYDRALVRAFDVSPAANVLLGRDGWLFFLGEDGASLDRYHRGTLVVTDEQIRLVVAELARRARFLASHGIGYVVTIAPDKSTIYPEQLPAWARRSLARTPLDRLVEALAAEGSVRFVDLRAPLASAKARERMYYTSDSHWNSLGAEVAYGEIMRAAAAALAPRAIAIAPPTRPLYVPGVDVYHGDLARMTGDPKPFGEPDYAPLWKILSAQPSRCAKRVDAGDDPGFEAYECQRAGLPRAVVYRDSMAIPLVPLLSENFSRVVYVSARRLDPDFVLRERADIVVEEMVERAMLAPMASPMP